jgi:hypothetical protein
MYVVDFISVHLLWLCTTSDPFFLKKKKKKKMVQPSCMADTLPHRKQFSIHLNFVALKMEAALSSERP